ncbi:MAG: hypothetical protein EOO75_09205 [Myxococcales bacterium]|nr:MAG: hypothetical protein EOO75_09205 [Myxococcales bacterium]
MKTRSVAVAAVLMLVGGCSNEAPRATQRLEEQARVEAKKKQDLEEATARQKKERDALVPKLLEARAPVDATFKQVWALMPELKTMKRQDCPDKQILADSPDEAARQMLVVNRESAYLLSGAADASGGRLSSFHTLAADHALTLRRAGGKETPLLDREPSDDTEKLQAQIDAAAYVRRFRYLGLGLISAFYPSDLKALPRPRPARVEGWLVVVDGKTGKPLCQVEASGEGLVHDGTVNTDSAGNEEAWAMFVRTAGKNIEAISKVLTVDGGPKKR